MNKILLTLLIGLVLSVSGCQTMEGLGEDIESAGKALKKKASE